MKNTSKSKVSCLIDEYELDEVGDELVERWTRTEVRQSLRQLVDFFDRQLLRAALTRETGSSHHSEIEILYQNLTDNGVTSGVYTQSRTQLEQHGIDIDQLLVDFVSRQAMHTYLTTVRNAAPPEKDRSPKELRDHKHKVIQRLKQRLIAVSEQTLSELAKADHLALGRFDILVRVQVYCKDCATKYTVTDLLTKGGCDCNSLDDQLE